jgi:hypothetical protein
MNFQVPVFPGDGIFRSLIIINNKIGPNFVPCGTPAVTANKSEVVPPSITHCLRLDRELITQWDQRAPYSDIDKLTNKHIMSDTIDGLCVV